MPAAGHTAHAAAILQVSSCLQLTLLHVLCALLLAACITQPVQHGSSLTLHCNQQLQQPGMRVSRSTSHGTTSEASAHLAGLRLAQMWSAHNRPSSLLPPTGCSPSHPQTSPVTHTRVADSLQPFAVLLCTAASPVAGICWHVVNKASQCRASCAPLAASPVTDMRVASSL